jgi:hypothetical protein
VESLETGKREKGNGPHERISNFFFSPSLSLSLSISHHGITIHSFKTVFFAGRQFLNSPSPFSLSSILSTSFQPPLALGRLFVSSLSALVILLSWLS